MAYRILVGSYANAVTTLVFDPPRAHRVDGGEPAGERALRVSSALEVGYHPSWLARHPSDPSLVFTGLEQPDGRLLAMKYDRESGTGRVVADVHSAGRDPCSIVVTPAGDVWVANYSSGTVGIFNLPPSARSSGRGSTADEAAEPYDLTPVQPVLVFAGKGPNVERQEGSHPHQVYLHEQAGQEEVLVPDLGADKIWRLAKNSHGLWTPVGEIAFEGEFSGGGPRHIGIYEEILYTALELTCTLAAHALHSSPPTLLASTSTLPNPPTSPPPPIPMLAAELLIAHPNAAFPTPYIYVSNRNDPRAEGDSIAILSTYVPSSPSPALEVVRVVHTGLDHLRGMILFGPDERYLIAGGQNGGGIKVFERTDGGTDLREIAWLPAEDAEGGLRPTSFLCL